MELIWDFVAMPFRTNCYSHFEEMDYCEFQRIFDPAGCAVGSNSNGQLKDRNHVNARESVNSAFNTLRDLIPTEPQNRKLSKIEILRLARSYIKHLDAVVSTGNIRQPCMTIYDPNSSPVPTPCSESTRPLICTFCIASKYN
ncbi:transcription factor 15 isoform X2 [Hermetia illucens]|uniref:transcription factor 15 isoform X2 n=1 Tax=Hermetia illucens TaxID=343691 RepID=UPI0018CC3DE6|nr:transcription factor 15 isoform X2 [Hermetia illucens]